MNRKTHVYELVDPRTDETFYIGSTVNPLNRYYAHLSSHRSAANGRMKEIEAAGQRTIMRIVASFPTEYEALKYEHKLTKDAPGVLNQRVCPPPKLGDIFLYTYRDRAKYNAYMRGYRAKKKAAK